MYKMVPVDGVIPVILCQLQELCDSSSNPPEKSSRVACAIPVSNGECLPDIAEEVCGLGTSFGVSGEF